MGSSFFFVEVPGPHSEVAEWFRRLPEPPEETQTKYGRVLYFRTFTGVNASEFSRVRQAKLDRFTIERLADMLDRLGEEVELQVRFRSKAGAPMAGAIA